MSNQPNGGEQQGPLKKVIQSLRFIPSRLSSSEETCKHEEFDATVNHDEERIWHLQDTYLQGDKYWTQTDAAFAKTRTRVKEFRCLGCGERRTITTGEVLEYHWKSEMSTEELAKMREKANTGGYYNGWLWWEDNIWEGNPKDVATRLDWIRNIGDTSWKEGGFND